MQRSGIHLPLYGISISGYVLLMGGFFYWLESLFAPAAAYQGYLPLTGGLVAILLWATQFPDLTSAALTGQRLPLSSPLHDLRSRGGRRCLLRFWSATSGFVALSGLVSITLTGKPEPLLLLTVQFLLPTVALLLALLARISCLL